MAKAPTYSDQRGAVPVDGDVRPFSMLKPSRGDTNRNNRRHHFISAVCVDGFAAEDSRVPCCIDGSNPFQERNRLTRLRLVTSARSFSEQEKRAHDDPAKVDHLILLIRWPGLLPYRGFPRRRGPTVAVVSSPPEVQAVFDQTWSCEPAREGSDNSCGTETSGYVYRRCPPVCSWYRGHSRCARQVATRRYRRISHLSGRAHMQCHQLLGRKPINARRSIFIGEYPSVLAVMSPSQVSALEACASLCFAQSM